MFTARRFFAAHGSRKCFGGTQQVLFGYGDLRANEFDLGRALAVGNRVGQRVVQVAQSLLALFDSIEGGLGVGLTVARLFIARRVGFE